MNLAQAILYIYPELINGKDFSVLQDGEDQIITWFNTSLTQPTKTELETAWEEFSKKDYIKTKMLRLQEIRRELVLIGYGTNLPTDTRLTPRLDTKALALTTEWDEIVADVDSTYDSTLVDSVLDAFFT